VFIKFTKSLKYTFLKVYEKWQIKLNHNKFDYTTFELRYGHCPDITVNYLHWYLFSTIKYLGLNLDKRLTW